MGAVAVGRVLALSAGAESEGLTGFRIDFVRRGLPTHGSSLNSHWRKKVQTAGGGRREGVS